MTRFGALASSLALVLVLGGCAAAKPTEPVPAPVGVELAAAAQVGDRGNGLWVLDGPTAASRVIDAIRAGGPLTMSARVQERTPVDGGGSVEGRLIVLERVGDRQNFRASFTVGDQSGDLVAVGERVWVRGNEAFAGPRGLGASDSYACVARSSALVVELESLLDPAEFTRTSLMGLEMGVLEPRAETPEVLAVVLGTGGAPIGELSAAAIGAPLPRQLVFADPTGSVSAEFAWGATDAVEPPEGAGDGCT